jgi:hypothetical protein
VTYVIQNPSGPYRDWTDTSGPSAPSRGWLDQWTRVRWRALGTWLVLAMATGLFLDHGYSWVSAWINFVVVTLAKLGFPLPARFLELGFIFASLSWFQPVLLRL